MTRSSQARILILLRDVATITTIPTITFGKVVNKP